MPNGITTQQPHLTFKCDRQEEVYFPICANFNRITATWLLFLDQTRTTRILVQCRQVFLKVILSSLSCSFSVQFGWFKSGKNVQNQNRWTVFSRPTALAHFIHCGGSKRHQAVIYRTRKVVSVLLVLLWYDGLPAKDVKTTYAGTVPVGTLWELCKLNLHGKLFQGHWTRI